MLEKKIGERPSPSNTVVQKLLSPTLSSTSLPVSTSAPPQPTVVKPKKAAAKETNALLDSVPNTLKNFVKENLPPASRADQTDSGSLFIVALAC